MGRVAFARVTRKDTSAPRCAGGQVHINVEAVGAGSAGEEQAAASVARQSDASQASSRRASARLAAGRSTWLVNAKGELRMRDQRAPPRAGADLRMSQM